MHRPKKEASYSIAELAEQLASSFEGDGERVVRGLCSFDEAQANCLAFYIGGSPSKDLLDPRLAELAGLIVRNSIMLPSELPFACIRVEHPLTAMSTVLPLFFEKAFPSPNIHPSAIISPSAHIGKNVHIGPFCVIGDHVHIEDEAILFPHVVLYESAVIGKASVLHARVTVREACHIGAGSCIQPGAVIGADGFGYMPSPSGLVPVPQIGRVLLADKVDVGANACIDRATFGTTKVGYGTKIDNLVQIGHNTHIGQHSVLCGQAGVAGSVSIGNEVMLAGMVGVVDHIYIGDKVRVAATGAVLRDLPHSGDYAGTPAIPKRAWAREILRYSRKFMKE